MKKLFIGLFLALVFSGCIGPVEPTYFKDTSALMTPECKEFNNDVCGALRCMVSGCWCKSHPDFPFETYIEVKSEQDAMNAVNAYIAELVFGGTDLIGEALNREVTEAHKMNSVFYMVIVDAEGTDEEYIVAADGTVTQMICGV
ncbi:MAG: hypothetical protein ABIA76_05580 [Candidatus Diapherotrites archaeon]